MLPFQIWYYSQGRVPIESQFSHLLEQKPSDLWSCSSWTSQNHTVRRAVCRGLHEWMQYLHFWPARHVTASRQHASKSESPHSFKQSVNLCPALKHSLEAQLQLSNLSCCKAKAWIPRHAPEFCNCRLNFFWELPPAVQWCQQQKKASFYKAMVHWELLQFGNVLLCSWSRVLAAAWPWVFSYDPMQN